jgi:hypothetical protein
VHLFENDIVQTLTISILLIIQLISELARSHSKSKWTCPLIFSIEDIHGDANLASLTVELLNIYM